jgi:uncharacterized protein YecE (DUF72 family)
MELAVSKQTQYHIGCSGYYYPAWRNKFYPAGLQPKGWLAYYSSVFNTVELNGTFYRMPKLSDLKKYAQVTPPDFTFSVKVNRFITHVNRLKEKQSIHDFQETVKEGLGDKLSAFLFQMPPSFQYSEENIERIIDNIPHEPQCVIEFRHISWWNETVRKTLHDARLTFCNADFPKLTTFIIPTSPEFYMRLHGNPKLFISSYSKEQLETFFDAFPKGNKRYHIYFNNTMYEAGYENARLMMDIINVNS